MNLFKRIEYRGHVPGVLASFLALALTPMLVTVHADIAEPDNVLYGIITLGGAPVTAARSDVVVEARKTANGSVISSYKMGTDPAFGDFYSLRVPLEAFSPLLDTNALRVGALVFLSVRDSSGPRDQRTLSIVNRGEIVRVDFVELDSDGDGLSDRWEQQYFSSARGAAPNADPDSDGRNNLREALDGTNPLVADGRHPADISPGDYDLTAAEVEKYANAWAAGERWAASPTNIPIAYVSRAASLFMAGGRYGYTNTASTNLSLAWVPLLDQAPPTPGTNLITSLNPPTSGSAGRPLTLTFRASPRPSTLAYAVQQTVPTNWTVQSISHGGSLDNVNHLVKWGPFYDNGERELSYTMVPPPGASGQTSFTGTGSFDGVNLTVSGSRPVVLSALANFRWSFAALDPNGLVFQLSGVPMTDYVIESSADLVHWDFEQKGSTGTEGIYSLRVGNTAGSGQRYFRARLDRETSSELQDNR
ncbi:MAG: hypothetical protein U1G07_16445 [Verrucomicrobiota bacterium]